MARLLRLQLPDGFFHVTSRSVDGLIILPDDDHRELLSRIVTRVLHKLEVRCHAFCFMGNHFHFIFETVVAELARAMQRISGQFAQSFNAQHGRTGHVFERRYRSWVIETEEHLVEAARYIELNPVRAGLCAAPESWHWSSYRALTGLSACPPFLSTDTILSHFGRQEEARAAYAGYVRETLAGALLTGSDPVKTPLQGLTLP